ncbi:MAG TPA: CRISPR-associated endoribonuclease Cas6, partial [Oscillospiraceae bacterium]|nr:CRISPR-associated endoribonuclease Cas6 [Oscillospiraceae bacterium]
IYDKDTLDIHKGDVLMKETITFQSINEKEIILPINYNHIVQAMIYNQLDNEIADFLHEGGFKKEKRVYKLFTFSRLNGNYSLDRKNGQIRFDSPIKLTISSPYSKFSNSVGNGILSNKTIRLGKNELEVKELAVKRETVNGNEIKIETMSPITAYSTLFRKDGKKFTYYFNPQEGEFSEIICNNLKNKYKAFYMKEPPEGVVEIESAGISKMSIINYKGFVIKGYMGRFYMRGPQELLQIGVEAGIGSKNSQGLGCMRII